MWGIKISTLDSSLYMPPMGGTEILMDGLIKNTKILEYDNINIIISNPLIDKVQYTKHNLWWQHLSYSDDSLLNLNSSNFIKNTQSQVYISHWQYEKFRYIFNVPTDNAYIIKNAIPNIEFIKKEKSKKIKLIYTSALYRGLDILLDCIEYLDRDDIELDVYSSTLLYGTNYAKFYEGVWDHIVDRAKNMKNVNYIGYVKNSEIHKALQDAHIFAYPSIFEETSCLSMIEAAAAGCSLLVTDLGALYETGSEYANFIPFQSSKELMIKKYSKGISDLVDKYWSISNQEHIKKQSEFYNSFYSWEKRSKEWNELFEKIGK